MHIDRMENGNVEMYTFVFYDSQWNEHDTWTYSNNFNRFDCKLI